MTMTAVPKGTPETTEEENKQPPSPLQQKYGQKLQKIVAECIAKGRAAETQEQREEIARRADGVWRQTCTISRNKNELVTLDEDAFKHALQHELMREEAMRYSTGPIRDESLVYMGLKRCTERSKRGTICYVSNELFVYLSFPFVVITTPRGTRLATDWRAGYQMQDMMKIIQDRKIKDITPWMEPERPALVNWILRKIRRPPK